MATMVVAIHLLMRPAEAYRAEYQNFATTVGLNVVGTAFKDESTIQLSGTKAGDTGAVWLTEPLNFSVPFTSVTFSFTMNKGFEKRGYEGMALVFQSASNAELPVRGGYEGIGYQGIERGVALEFDTHKNDERSDPSGDATVREGNPGSHHVAWLMPKAPSLGKTPVATSDHEGQAAEPYLMPDRELNNRESYTISVTYDHTEKVLTTTMDGVELLFHVNNSAAGSVSGRVPANLPELIGAGSGGVGFVGFTAATGAAFQRVHLWSIGIRQTTDGTDPCLAGFSGAGCDPDLGGGDCSGAGGCHSCVTQPPPCEWLSDRCAAIGASAHPGVRRPGECSSSSSLRFVWVLLAATLAVGLAYAIVWFYNRRQRRSGNQYAARAHIFTDNYAELH